MGCGASHERLEIEESQDANYYNQDTDFDLKEFVNSIKEAHEKICLQLGSEELTSIILMGQTKAGKSTLTNLLSQCGLKIIKKNGILEFENSGDEDDGSVFAKIGGIFLSQTKIPNSIIGNKYIVWDCAGFFDNRGKNQKLKNAYYIKRLFEIHRSFPGQKNKINLKLIYVIAEYTLSNNYQLSTQSLQELTMLFRDNQMLREHLGFVISHTKSDVLPENIQYNIKQYVLREKDHDVCKDEDQNNVEYSDIEQEEQNSKNKMVMSQQVEELYRIISPTKNMVCFKEPEVPARNIQQIRIMYQKCFLSPFEEMLQNLPDLTNPKTNYIIEKKYQQDIQNIYLEETKIELGRLLERFSIELFAFKKKELDPLLETTEYEKIVSDFQLYKKRLNLIHDLLQQAINQKTYKKIGQVFAKIKEYSCSEMPTVSDIIDYGIFYEFMEECLDNNNRNKNVNDLDFIQKTQISPNFMTTLRNLLFEFSSANSSISSTQKEVCNLLVQKNSENVTNMLQQRNNRIDTMLSAPKMLINIGLAFRNVKQINPYNNLQKNKYLQYIKFDYKHVQDLQLLYKLVNSTKKSIFNDQADDFYQKTKQKIIEIKNEYDIELQDEKSRQICDQIYATEALQLWVNPSNQNMGEYSKTPLEFYNLFTEYERDSIIQNRNKIQERKKLQTKLGQLEKQIKLIQIEKEWLRNKDHTKPKPKKDGFFDKYF